MLEKLRREVCRWNQELPRNGLVAWTSGNVSARDAKTGLIVIKPSGVVYEALTPENMVVVDADGKRIEGKLNPSVDTPTHLYIYKNRPDVGGIVHTHSNFATAFAAVGKPIPAILTAICDEFGGEIPVGKFAPIGGEEIGREVVRAIGASPAILMQNHGVFTVGKDAGAAVKAAVMVEDIARTVFYAMQLGRPIAIPKEMVAQLHKRYTDKYGQK
ncbi:MAG: L-ribulose-5-phosphate 4-epimerase [Anaerolineales bacterium]|nr:L-ribulose-5-phosphate 4-epimerase [Anaerolineales bacterium]